MFSDEGNVLVNLFSHFFCRLDGKSALDYKIDIAIHSKLNFIVGY